MRAGRYWPVKPVIWKLVLLRWLTIRIIHVGHDFPFSVLLPFPNAHVLS